jgi:hypothetical protein
MYGLVGVTQAAPTLPIVVAFFGGMVCFAGWAALMIRLERAPRRTGHTSSPRGFKAGVVTQSSRAGAYERVRARALVLRPAADVRVSQPYLLPMPYAVALQGTGESIHLQRERAHATPAELLSRAA